MLLEEGLNVKVLLFPDGHDPDSYVQKHGSTVFKEYIDQHQEDFVFFKTNILLKDSGDDPIKRAEVIRDVVESIALIPDEIKVSLYIRRCSTLLDIEERALLSELNKIRIAKSKAKTKKSTPSSSEQPPADFFAEMLGGEGRVAVDDPAKAEEMQQISTEILQERELVRILLNYGHDPVTWDEDSPNIPIAPYLLANFDDVTFEDKACDYIIGVFKEKALKEEIPEAKWFIAHEDKAVSELAVSSLATRYEISPNWNDDKRKIYVSTEKEHLKDLVTQVVYRLKKRKVERKLIEIREEMKKEHTLEDIEILMADYKKYKDYEIMLGNLLGNTIVK